jgi:hypothetical protein
MFAIRSLLGGKRTELKHAALSRLRVCASLARWRPARSRPRELRLTGRDGIARALYVTANWLSTIGRSEMSSIENGPIKLFQHLQGAPKT